MRRLQFAKHIGASLPLSPISSSVDADHLASLRLFILPQSEYLAAAVLPGCHIKLLHFGEVLRLGLFGHVLSLQHVGEANNALCC